MTKTKVKVTAKVKVTGIPQENTVEYLARDAATQSKYYVVHRPADQGYNSFRLNIGPRTGLKEAVVAHVERYKDGGTTSINYTFEGLNGTLYFPTPFDKEAKPTDTYNGYTVQLEKLLENK